MNDLSSILAEIRAMPVKVRRNRAYGLKRKPDGNTIPILLALLGEVYDDDPDRDSHFNAIRALKDLCPESVPFLVEAIKPDPGHPNDDWRRYWVTMALVKIETDEVANLLVDLIENDTSRSVAGVVLSVFRKNPERIAVVDKDKLLKAVRKRIELEPDNCKDYCSWICREVLKKLEENPG